MRVNPYFYLLLRRMIDFEVERKLNEAPKISAIGEYIITRCGNTPYTRYWVEKLRRQVLSKKDFDFKEDLLDYLCSLTDTFGKFSCWKEFVKEQAKYALAVNLERFERKAHSQLSADEKQFIQSLVERRMGKLYDRTTQQGHLYSKTKQNIRLEEDRFVYKIASGPEVEKIVNLARRVYPCPINDSNIKSKWHLKNPNIFFICLDSFGELMANINILPIQPRTFENLRDGVIYENEIVEQDLFSPEEKDQVRHIYVEGFASISRDAQYGFRSRFPVIISELANTEDDREITICAIGGSIEGDNLMKTYGFQEVSLALDRKNNQRYPFYTATFKSICSVIALKSLSIDRTN